MKKRPLCSLCLIFILVRGLIMAVTGGQMYSSLPASSIFLEEGEQEVLLQGQVYQKTGTSKIQILYLKNNSIYSQKQSFYESKLIVYDDTFQDIEIGKTVKLRGKAERFDEARNPGNFDQREYYQKQDIYGMVWSEQIIEVTGEENRFLNRLYNWKQEWKERLIESMGEKNGQILSAILLSEKKEMDAQVKELYQKNGIGHILAISGLHISFIGLGVYHLLRKAGCSYRMAGILSGILLFLYVFMIGFSISVVRAVFMLLLRIGADISGRVYDMATALFLAGAVTVLVQPLYLTDAGFLMSYGAILGILTVLPAMEKLYPCRFSFLKGMYASFSINLILFPVLLYFYFEFPTYSVLLNMIVIPLMSWVMGLGLFGSIFLFVYRPLGNVLVNICSLILSVFEELSRIGSRLPGARIVFGKPFWQQICLYYAMLFLMLFFIYKRKEKKEKAILKKCMIVIFPIMISLFLTGHGTKGSVEVTVIDVGQGDGILIRGPENKACLIDGGSSDVNEVGKYRLEPFLKSKGVGKLDYIFVSHGDIDHYSGVEELILRQDVGIRIEALVLPAVYQKEEALCNLASLAAGQGIEVLSIEPGTKLQEGELNITCMQPGKDFAGEIGNASSMILEIEFYDFRMLCTGDVEEEGEIQLTEKLGKKTYTILKAAHHGSKNSSQKAFLDIVQPKITLISAGIENRYGHPHAETLERLKDAGSTVYNTADHGAITLRSDGKGLWIEGFH